MDREYLCGKNLGIASAAATGLKEVVHVLQASGETLLCAATLVAIICLRFRRLTKSVCRGAALVLQKENLMS